MRTRRTAARLTIGVSAWLACACEAGPPDLLFKAPVGRLPQGIQRAYYPNLGPGDSVEVKLPGEWYEPARELRVIERQDASRSSPLAAAEAAYSAFKRSDDAWILASFAVQDRDDIRSFLADSSVRAGSRAYFGDIRGELVYGWAGYVKDSTEYRLLFITHLTPSPIHSVETYVWEEGEWRRTNRLARERDVHVAWSAFVGGRVAPE